MISTAKATPRKQKTQHRIATVQLTYCDHGLSNESPYTSGFSFAKWQSWNGWFLRPICNLLCCNFFIIDIHCDLQRDENFEQSFWFKVLAQRYRSQVQWILIRDLAVAEDKLQWPPQSSLSWVPHSWMFSFRSNPYSLGWSWVTEKHFFKKKAQTWWSAVLQIYLPASLEWFWVSFCLGFPRMGTISTFVICEMF